MTKDDFETVTIPVVEEALTVGRRTVDTGLVRVRTIPETRTEAISEPLLRTTVEVERVARDEEIVAVPAIREEGDTIIVPVVEERLVRKLFLVEEVRLSRRASTETLEQSIELRSQRVVVEREESSGAPSAEE